MKIAAIMRASAYSPNHIGNDAAILNAVVGQLRAKGYHVDIYSEDAFCLTPIDADVIIDMCRSPQAVARLKRLEDQGRLVINSGYGIENCTRESMTRMLVDAGIPYPRSIIVNTDNPDAMLADAGFDNCWIKRGDFHAVHKEDVSYARHCAEARGILHEYCLRGIERAVVSEHLRGDLVKFYGIAGSDFFYWFYPFDHSHSKYGHEAINGKSQGYKFSADNLREMAQRASCVLDVDIYGGDCIVDESGNMAIIDFNDWPSFAPCCDDAAPHIANMIDNKIRKRFDF